MKLLSLYNIKGGVGKTALTTLIAYRLSEQGKKVLCIDADLQANLTHVLYKVNHQDATIVRALKDGASADEIIIKSPNQNYPNLDLIPGDIETCLLTEYLALQTAREKTVAKWLRNNSTRLNEYDYIFVDLSPSIELHNRCWLYCLDSMILVLKHGDIHSVRGAELLNQIYKADMDALEIDDNCLRKTLINGYKNTKEDMMKLFDQTIERYPFVGANLLTTRIAQKALSSKSASMRKIGLNLMKSSKEDQKTLAQIDELINELGREGLL